MRKYRNHTRTPVRRQARIARYFRALCGPWIASDAAERPGRDQGRARYHHRLMTLPDRRRRRAARRGRCVPPPRPRPHRRRHGPRRRRGRPRPSSTGRTTPASARSPTSARATARSGSRTTAATRARSAPTAGSRRSRRSCSASSRPAGSGRGSSPGRRRRSATLKAQGHKLAIVSNADGSVEAQLAADGICQVGPGRASTVDAVLDSSVVGVAKPDPAHLRDRARATRRRRRARDPRRRHAGRRRRRRARRRASPRCSSIPYDDHPELAVTRVASLAEVAAQLAR